MGKKERARRMKAEGLHEIKNKYRTRAVKKRKKGLVLTPQKRRRALKACASLSAIFILILGGFAIGNSFFKDPVFNEVPDDFVTVSYEPPKDGSTPDNYTGLENIGYMNYRFKQQKRWYAETHGTTFTTIGPQSVNTIKQYSDGVLIMADVTSGSKLVEAGRQFCYVGDEVMWREVPDNSSYKMDSYEDMLDLTFNDYLEKHVTVETFKKANGLPGTEMTVYIINEDTIDHADQVQVVKSGYAAGSDWTWEGKSYVKGPVYRQTFYLRPGDSENLGAAAHYANQVVFTGSLQGVTFTNQIKVTYTFDSTWQILQADIEESYKAQKGVINTSCSSSFKTVYEYNTERCKNPAYEEFFKDLVGHGVSDKLEKQRDSLDYLIDAFLSKPVTFELNASINGKTTSGRIALDAHNLDIEAIMAGGDIDIAAALGSVALKLQLGDIYIYLDEATAYLQVNDLKVKMPIDDLLKLILKDKEEPAPIEPAPSEPEDGEGDPDDESSIFDLSKPVVSEDGKTVMLTATLDLTSLGVKVVVPLNFVFDLDENKDVSLNKFDLNLEYKTIKAGIEIKGTDKTFPALGDKNSFVDLYPYAETVYDLIMGEKLELGVNYQDANMALTGNIGIDYSSSELLVVGNLTLAVGAQQKTVALAVKGSVVYINIDGIKLSVAIEDAKEFVKGLLATLAPAEDKPAAQTEGAEEEESVETALDKILSLIFDEDLASKLFVTEKEDVLTIGLKGTEILKLFGINFDLGDVTIDVAKANKTVTASAYGASVTMKALTRELTLDTTGYVNAVTFADAVLNLLQGNTLTARLSFETELAGSPLFIDATVVLDYKSMNASGVLNLTYVGVTKSVNIIYGKDGYLYLTLDALKGKVNLKNAVAVIGSLLSPNNAAALDDAVTPDGEESNVYAIIEKVLSINFGELLTLSEETKGTINGVLNGNKLLQLFGSDFALGNITLAITADEINASALGIDVTLTAGGTVVTLTETEMAEFTDLQSVLDKIPDLVPYAETVYNLIAGKKLEISLNYQDDNMALTGNVGIDYSDGLIVAAELTLAVGAQQKTVTIAVKDSVAYLSVEGIKLSVGVEDAVELVTGILTSIKQDGDTKSAPIGGISVESILATVLSTVFDTDFLDQFFLTDADDVLTLGAEGTELLKMFGIDFDLGQVTIAVAKQTNTITATAYGATLTVSALGRELAVDTADYVDVIYFANTIIAMLESGTLTASLDYTATLGGSTFELDASLVLDYTSLNVSGVLNLKYGALEKTVYVYYGDDGVIYLTIDTLNLKLNVKQAIGVILSMLNADSQSGGKTEKEEEDVYAIIEKVLSLNFEEFIKLSESTDEEGNRLLTAVVNGKQLLELLGVDFDLGSVTLVADAEKVSVNALGIDAVITGGGEVELLSESEKAAYVDMMPVLERIPDILKYKALALDGKVTLVAGDLNVGLNVKQAVIDFNKGVKAYINAEITVTEAVLALQVYVDTESVKLVMGNLGIDLKFTDFATLGDAALAMYEELRNAINSISDSELLPEVKSIDDILNLVSSLLKKDDRKGDEKDGKSIGDMLDPDAWLSGIMLANSTKDNGLLAISLMGITLNLVNLPQGFVGADVTFEKDDLSVWGHLNADVYKDTFPEMPDMSYLGVDDFVELLDYLVAAVHTLNENNINLTLTGVIYSDDTEKYPDGQYNMTGDIRLYSGENTAVHLNIDKKSLWVDTDTYLYVNLALDPIVQNDKEKGTYIELFVLDYDTNGNSDGEMLDVYVSVSNCLPTTARNPLTVYGTAAEIMPILSSVVAFLGVDIDVLNDYLLAPWLTSLETVGQLRGLGESILLMMGDLGVNLGGGNSSGEGQGVLDIGALISAVTIDKESGTFELQLSAKEIFGTEEGDPLTITIGKETDEETGSSRLTMLSVKNIGNTWLQLDLGYENKKILPPLNFKSTIALDGIMPLLKTLAFSTTHVEDDEVISGEETPHHYVLNRNFYIDGSITIDLNAIGIVNVPVNIKLVAFSITIDEEGTVGVNVRFEYEAVKALLGTMVVINGDTQVDLTGKDNMVYIKRSQKTDADRVAYTKAKIIYRAMPLSKWTADIMNQMGFLFNFGSRLTSILSGINMSGGAEKKEDKDLGLTVSEILNSFVYTPSANGDTWEISINGMALNDVLRDIVVTIGSDKEGKVRTLNVSLNLEAVNVIKMKLAADFKYHNPCAVMDEDIIDITRDIADELINGMDWKLDNIDWTDENNVYVDGEMVTLEYILSGNKWTQDIVIGMNADAGILYGTPVYPDVSAFMPKGYKVVWDHDYEAGQKLENTQINGRPVGITYELTFVFADGSEQTVEYVYGSTDFELPFRRADKRRVAYYKDAAGNEYRTAADLMNLDLEGDFTLTAVYEDDLYTVTYYVDEDNVQTQQAFYEDTVTLTAREREGYLFAGWYLDGQLLPAGSTITITGDLTLIAQWTEASAGEATYLVTVLSDLQHEGFIGHNGVYTMSYAYNGEAITLAQLSDIDPYEFMGYYTEPNGKGEQISTITSLESNMTVYVWWLSKIVTFNVYSNYAYEGATYDVAKDGYYVQYTVGEGEYTLGDSYLPTLAGYKAIALMYNGANGWKNVTNESARYLDGADIWVFWIDDFKLTVTGFSVDRPSWSSNYKYIVSGHVEGGAPSGVMSQLIFAAIGRQTTLYSFTIFQNGGNGNYPLATNKTLAASGEFSDEVSTRSASSWKDVFGGVAVTRTITLDGKVTTLPTLSKYICETSFTVTFNKNNGTDPITVTYTPEYNVKINTYEFAKANGVTLPEKEGYTVTWSADYISGNMTIDAIYTANKYMVRFESEQFIAGWEALDGMWVYYEEMFYDSEVTFYYQTELLGQYTVGLNSVFKLPTLRKDQKWTTIEIETDYAYFYAQRNVDMVIYVSDIAYTAGGVTFNDSHSEEVVEGYELLQPTATAEGYNFLGWYAQVNGVWTLITEITPSEGETKGTTTLHALWEVAAVSLAYDGTPTKGTLGKYSATIKVSGGYLVGAFASEANVTVAIRTFLSSNANYHASSSNSTDSISGYTGQETRKDLTSFTSWSSDKYLHTVVTITWSYNGQTYGTYGGENAHIYHKF